MVPLEFQQLNQLNNQGLSTIDKHPEINGASVMIGDS